MEKSKLKGVGAAAWLAHPHQLVRQQVGYPGKCGGRLESQPPRPPAAVPLMALQLGFQSAHRTVPPPGRLLGTEKYSQW